jgi:hypothetical protein
LEVVVDMVGIEMVGMEIEIPQLRWMKMDE